MAGKQLMENLDLDGIKGKKTQLTRSAAFLTLFDTGHLFCYWTVAMESNMRQIPMYQCKWPIQGLSWLFIISMCRYKGM